MKYKTSYLSVGIFLALRDLKRSNIWTTVLIVFVMALTYFNMLLLGGIFLGLSEGITGKFKLYYSSDIFITPSKDKTTIERTGDVITVLESLSTFQAASPRLTSAAIVEHGYQTKVKPTDLAESVAGLLVGIEPESADRVTDLSRQLIAGEYLEPTDVEYVMLGQDLFEQYQSGPPDDDVGVRLLKDVKVGSKVRITVNGKQKEFIVKGIVGTDNSNIDNRIFVTMPTARGLINSENLDVTEIAVKLESGASQEVAKAQIAKTLNNPNVTIQTSEEALPSASEDIKRTFAVLANIIGAISLIVGAITIFIVIFVNAITRRKYIGILKGIGISARSIQLSYVVQALCYAVAGIVVGAIFLIGYLKPYFALHPIVLPIAEGALVINNSEFIIKALLLIITSLISGFVPALIVTRQNTLDAILGR